MLYNDWWYYFIWIGKCCLKGAICSLNWSGLAIAMTRLLFQKWKRKIFLHDKYVPWSQYIYPREYVWPWPDDSNIYTLLICVLCIQIVTSCFTKYNWQTIPLCLRNDKQLKKTKNSTAFLAMDFYFYLFQVYHIESTEIF